MVASWFAGAVGLLICCLFRAMCCGFSLCCGFGVGLERLSILLNFCLFVVVLVGLVWLAGGFIASG